MVQELLLDILPPKIDWKSQTNKTVRDEWGQIFILDIVAHRFPSSFVLCRGAIVKNKDLTPIWFVKVQNKKTAKEIYSIDFPTLHIVDYETTEGNGKIIMTPKGTDQYNIHVHGGNITMKSWLGHKRHIWVHCTSFATEGIMTDMTLRKQWIVVYIWSDNLTRYEQIWHSQQTSKLSFIPLQFRVITTILSVA